MDDVTIIMVKHFVPEIGYSFEIEVVNELQNFVHPKDGCSAQGTGPLEETHELVIGKDMVFRGTCGAGTDEPSPAYGVGQLKIRIDIPDTKWPVPNDPGRPDVRKQTGVTNGLVHTKGQTIRRSVGTFVAANQVREVDVDGGRCFADRPEGGGT